MIRRLVAMMLSIVLTACSVVPSRPAVPAETTAGHASNNTAVAQSGSDQTSAQQSAGSDAEAPASRLTGAGRVIAAVVVIALIFVGLAALGRSAERDFREHCCRPR